MAPSLNRLLNCYKKSVIAASLICWSQILIVPLILLAYIVSSFLMSFVSSTGLGFAGGFILGLIQLSLITYIYKWIWLAREKQLPSFSGLKPIADDDPWAHVKKNRRGKWFEEVIAFDSELFLLIINAAFPIFLVEFAVSFSGGSSLSLPVFIKLGIVFIFNPLPEVILINRTNGLSAIGEAAFFVKNRLLEWFIPIVLLFTPLLFLVSSATTWLQSIVLLMASSEVLLPGELIGRPATELIAALLPTGPLVGILIGTIFGVWISFFRLELFERLQSVPENRP